MINYNEISHFLAQRLSHPSNFYSFEEDNPETLQLIGDTVDSKMAMQSGRFILTEENLQLLVWYESKKLFKNGDDICLLVNNLLTNHCLGLKFEFRQKGSRNFFGFCINISLPNPAIEEAKFDTLTIRSIINDFLDDYVGYSLLWIDNVEYKSRCVIPLSNDDKYFYPNLQSRIAKFLMDPNDDFSEII